jgi:non-ribosomal peptide synthetase component F
MGYHASVKWLSRLLLTTKASIPETVSSLQEMPAPPGHRSALQPPSLIGRALTTRVQEWNRTYRDYPLDKTIAWFLEEQAGKTPSQLAVIADGESLTYRELNHQVNELAHHLRGLGVRPDTLVGVHMERGVEMVVALLAVVKAGGAYVPFDPDYPHERLAFMLRDSEVSVLLSQESLRVGLPAAEVSTICLDSAEWLQRRRTSNAANPPTTVHPDSLVYMIYTSGSTGKPKGVPNVHRGLVNRLLWMQETFQLDAQDRVLQKTPFSFDVSVWEFFWPLMTGATLVMAKPGGHKDSADLALHWSDTFPTENMGGWPAKPAPATIRMTHPSSEPAAVMVDCPSVLLHPGGGCHLHA